MNGPLFHTYPWRINCAFGIHNFHNHIKGKILVLFVFQLWTSNKWKSWTEYQTPVSRDLFWPTFLVHQILVQIFEIIWFSFKIKVFFDITIKCENSEIHYVNIGSRLKMFLKPVWVGKIHGVRVYATHSVRIWWFRNKFSLFQLKRM